MQKKLKHIVTHGGRLDQCGDWDQQANWSNCVIPLWVMDDKYDQAACGVKEELPLPVEKRQAEPAQAAGAKRKLTSQ